MNAPRLTATQQASLLRAALPAHTTQCRRTVFSFSGEGLAPIDRSSVKDAVYVVLSANAVPERAAHLGATITWSRFAITLVARNTRVIAAHKVAALRASAREGECRPNRPATGARNGFLRGSVPLNRVLG